MNDTKSNNEKEDARGASDVNALVRRTTLHSHFRPCTDEIAEAFKALLEMLDHELDEHPGVGDEIGKSRSLHSSIGKYDIPQNLVEPLNKLWHAIDSDLNAIEERAKKRARNWLADLNSGEITLEDFEER